MWTFSFFAGEWGQFSCKKHLVQAGNLSSFMFKMQLCWKIWNSRYFIIDQITNYFRTVWNGIVLQRNINEDEEKNNHQKTKSNLHTINQKIGTNKPGQIPDSVLFLHFVTVRFFLSFLQYLVNSVTYWWENNAFMFINSMFTLDIEYIHKSVEITFSKRDNVYCARLPDKRR